MRVTCQLFKSCDTQDTVSTITDLLQYVDDTNILWLLKTYWIKKLYRNVSETPSEILS